jgi:hypothetical protein
VETPRYPDVLRYDGHDGGYKNPSKLDVCGKAYDDNYLLEMASSYEDASHQRTAPKGTPELESDMI